MIYLRIVQINETKFNEYTFRPAAYTDFISIYIYRFFTLTIWQNTDFHP